MAMHNTSTVDTWLRTAVNAQRAGDLHAAKSLYEDVLAVEPRNADALHLLGLIDFRQGDMESALRNIQAAIASDPTFGDAYRSLGRVHGRNGKLPDALAACRKAMELNPMDAWAAFEAGTLCHHWGDSDQALAFYRHALAINPHFAECYNGLGLVFKSLKRMKDALQCFTKAIQEGPGLVEAHNNMGTMYKDQGRYPSAIRSFAAAVKVDPNYSPAHYNLGLLFDEIGRCHDAIRCYRDALTSNPALIQVHNNLGISLEKMGRTAEAMQCFKKAMEVDPDNPSAFLNAGIVCHHQNNLERAIAYTKQAIQKNSGDIRAYITLYDQLRQGCCWNEVTQIGAKIDTHTAQALRDGKQPAESPFLAITRSENRQRNMEIALSWGKAVQRKASCLSPPFAYDVRPKQKITVGFLSNRFRNAATGHLLAGLFACFDTQRFAIHCYSWGEDDGSYFRKTIETNCTRFIDISKMGFVDAATEINRDGVDILVDLKGYTRNNRIEICALQPAPIQIAYMNHNGTSGAPFFDYLVGDRHVVPENHKKEYSEKIIYMPNSFMAADPALGMDMKPIRRNQRKFPENVFVYCCFNQSYKIEPSVFGCWMKILTNTNNSVLWLLNENRLAISNLRKEAMQYGIDPQRLVFANKVNKKKHLERLRHADAVLDTGIYNGHTTTVDALLSGLPVVAKKGNQFASRVSSSLLSAIGLRELITESDKEYVDRAIQLCRNYGEVERIKEKIRINKRTTPLFDTRKFARNLEEAFIQVWNRYLHNFRAEHVYIK